MLLGIRLKANPTAGQKLILSRWMGCARLIWNAKCDEESYYATFARKYYPIGTYAPIDQTTAQFTDKELTLKAGLNKAILDKGWHQLEVFTKYKTATTHVAA